MNCYGPPARAELPVLREKCPLPTASNRRLPTTRLQVQKMEIQFFGRGVPTARKIREMDKGTRSAL